MNKMNVGMQNMMNLGIGRSKDLSQLNSQTNSKAASNVFKQKDVSAESSKFSDIVKDKNLDAGRVSKSPETADRQTVEEKPSQQKQLQSKSQEVAVEEARPKAVTRQQAMSLFLQQMETQLGVEPEEIVEAFAALDAATLMSAPEESSDKVISQLGLGAAEEQKAKMLYQDMLAMSAAAGMSGYLNQTGQTANLNVLSEKEAHQLKLQQSLDKMNDQFFMRGAFSAQKANPTGMSAYERMNAMPDAMGMPSSLADAPLHGGEFPDQMAANFEQGELNNPAMNFVAGENAEITENQDGRMTASESSALLTQAQTPDMAADPSAVQPDGNSDIFNMMESADGSDMVEFLNKNTIPQNNGMGSGIEASELQSGVVPVQYGASQGAEDFSESENHEGHEDMMSARVQDLGHQQKTVDGKTAFQMTAPAPTEMDVKENVKEIISQAQFLAKKGGGEMKVSLSPEGIGDLSLKVKMADGQVNVEMVTSSDEAKKMLEKGLSELKESLATHKLHLDSVKIENSKDISNQLADQRQDLERQFQQKFMNDFRERNNSFRNEFFEIGSPRVAKSQTRDEAANAGYDSGKKRRPDGSTRRLDLVA